MSTLPEQYAGIDAPLTNEDDFKQQILPIFHFITRSRTHMQEIFPNFSMELCMKSYMVLCFLYMKPRPVAYTIRIETGMTGKTLTKILPQLVKLELIREVPRPRLVVPFQAYRICVGYMITTKGKRVLRKIL